MTTFDITAVTHAYLDTMLWTGHYYAGEDVEPEPLDDHYGMGDIPDDLAEDAMSDVADFVNNLDEDGLTERVAEHWDDGQLGHDFALTRNRHGAGFWDRGRGDIGDILTDRAHPYGEWNLIGDPSGIYAD